MPLGLVTSCSLERTQSYYRLAPESSFWAIWNDKNSKKLGNFCTACVICCSLGKSSSNTIGFVPQEVSARHQMDSGWVSSGQNVDVFKFPMTPNCPWLVWKTPTGYFSQRSWGDFIFLPSPYSFPIEEVSMCNSKVEVGQGDWPELTSVFFIFLLKRGCLNFKSG